MKYWICVLSLIFVACASPNKKLTEVNISKQVPNHLINESSPYLKQHAYNPVNWYPWGKEALMKAKKEDKMLIISIGYSACHWCHVMEHESFEDTAVAALMNKYFVSVKIDREERPDLDQVYMSTVQLMNNGRGGWPLNAIALPDGRPVFGGTYFPKEKWISILTKLGKMYRKDKRKMVQYAEKVTAGVSDLKKLVPDTSRVAVDVKYLANIVAVKKWSFDKKNGGSDRSPKFPLPNKYEFLLDYGILKNDSNVLKHVSLTLDKMAMGGIFDQVGAGFCRYSVDKKWKVPHFEKMLYDNAQLVSLYAKAYGYYKKIEYREVVVRTIDFLKRELKGKDLYYSALDADSEGEEGKFYVWKQSELKLALGVDYPKLSSFYKINREDEWEGGKYILLRHNILDDFSPNDQESYRSINEKLLVARSKRERPGLDDKGIVAWNALLITAYVDAYNVLGNANYLAEAQWISKQINEKCYKDGTLMRIMSKNSWSPAFLDDYALWAKGLLDLYECTFNESYLIRAEALVEKINKEFKDSTSATYFYYGVTNEPLIFRPKEVNDNVIPGSNSVLAHVLYRLGLHMNKKNYSTIAVSMLNEMKSSASKYNSGYSNWLSLANNITFSHKEVVFTGKNALQLRSDFLKQSYYPNVLIAGSIKESDFPLLKNRVVNESTIYVCEDGACSLPLKTIKDLLKELR